MGKNGGTKIYCPSCEEIQICEAKYQLKSKHVFITKTL